jgi:hypothetical protein
MPQGDRFSGKIVPLGGRARTPDAASGLRLSARLSGREMDGAAVAVDGAIAGEDVPASSAAAKDSPPISRAAAPMSRNLVGRRVRDRSMDPDPLWLCYDRSETGGQVDAHVTWRPGRDLVVSICHDGIFIAEDILNVRPGSNVVIGL